MKKSKKQTKITKSYSSEKIGRTRRTLLLLSIVIILSSVASLFIYYILNYSNKFKGDINAAPTLTITPTQPGAVVYNNSSSACAYKQPGSLVLAGRANYADTCFKQVSEADGHVLIYIDAVLFNATGRYHKMLYENSECGGSASHWPGSPRFNSYGVASDFRVGSVVQQKLECVLEKMVAENPHMAGFFADDLGSANGPLQNSAFNKEEWYQGAVALSKTFRKVANKYNLLFMVNGVWQGGSQNGGYPVRSQTGNALADGICVEHHPVIEGSFSWPNFLKAPQWADQSPVTNGNPVHFVIAFDYQFNGWKNTTDNGAAWLTSQAGDGGYSSAPSPWGSFHKIGLPTKVTQPGNTPTNGGGAGGGSTSSESGSTGGSQSTGNSSTGSGEGNNSLSTRTDQNQTSNSGSQQTSQIGDQQGVPGFITDSNIPRETSDSNAINIEKTPIETITTFAKTGQIDKKSGINLLKHALIALVIITGITGIVLLGIAKLSFFEGFRNNLKLKKRH